MFPFTFAHFVYLLSQVCVSEAKLITVSHGLKNSYNIVKTWGIYNFARYLGYRGSKKDIFITENFWHCSGFSENSVTYCLVDKSYVRHDWLKEYKFWEVSKENNPIKCIIIVSRCRLFPKMLFTYSKSDPQNITYIYSGSYYISMNFWWLLRKSKLETFTH